MKEDLAEWLNAIHSGLALTADDFFDQLETGVVLCRQRNRGRPGLLCGIGIASQKGEVDDRNRLTRLESESVTSGGLGFRRRSGRARALLVGSCHAEHPCAHAIARTILGL